MKRTHKIILFLAAFILAVACNENLFPEPGGKPVPSDNLVTLDIVGAITKAPTTEAGENTVDHVDILLFKDNNGKPGERFGNPISKTSAELSASSRITLGSKADFADAGPVWVYVIANAGQYYDQTSKTLKDIDFRTVTDFDKLCELSQTDMYVHLSAHPDLADAAVDIPPFFLMDGVAYDTNLHSEEPADNKKTAVTLYEANNTANVELMVILRRAAAKIKIYILESTEDEVVEVNGKPKPDEMWVDFNFKLSTDNATSTLDPIESPGFYFRDLPYSTSVLGANDKRYEDYIKNVGGTERERHEASIRKTGKYGGVRFDKSSLDDTEPANDKIEITAYAYARNWSAVQSMLGTSIVVNIPMTVHDYTYYDYETEQPFLYEEGVTETVQVEGESNPRYYKWHEYDLASNYYQIPVSQDKTLERNKYYEVTVRIKYPGGSEPGEPVTLTDIDFEVVDWKEVGISIGDSNENPAYLFVNQDEMSMYNISEDDNTLEFASSTPVSVEVVNYYFKNATDSEVYRYPIKTEGVYDSYVLDINGNRTVNTDDFEYYERDEYGKQIKDDDHKWEASVSAEATGLNGNIKINTDIPGDNAVRYIILKITNEDGLSEQIKVAVYPLEYITHVEGWYSYREDFLGTTYEHCGGKHVTGKRVTELEDIVPEIRYRAGSGIYEVDNEEKVIWFYNESDFRSKFANPNGNSFYIKYYSWDASKEYTRLGTITIPGYYSLEWVSGYYNPVYELQWNEPVEKEAYITTYTIDEGSSAGNNLNNPRMYNIHISAASKIYNLGAPRLNAEGVTDGSIDNAKLVSPSFMLASQLGAYDSSAINDVREAGDHCKKYVEAYEEKDADGEKTGRVIHLHDWRLPTQAELKFLQIYQDQTPAMAKVLTGDYYWAANGLIKTSDGSLHTGSVSGLERAIRCVRDAFDIPPQREKTLADGKIKSYPIMKDEKGNLLPVE